MKYKRGIMRRITDFAGDLTEAPVLGRPGGYSFTVSDGDEIYVNGCCEILSYSDEEIMLGVNDGKLLIGGEGLDIVRYSDCEITARGKIIAVSVIGKSDDCGRA